MGPTSVVQPAASRALIEMMEREGMFFIHTDYQTPRPECNRGSCNVEMEFTAGDEGEVSCQAKNAKDGKIF